MARAERRVVEPATPSARPQQEADGGKAMSEDDARGSVGLGSGRAVGEGDRRARRRDAVAERIIAAAREALLERTDADSLSLRDVARRADFTPGALYRYFDSRQALLVSLFNEALDLLASYVDPAMQGARGIPRLRRMSLAYLAFGREHPQDLALIFQSAAHVPTWEEYVALARPFSSLVAALREDAEAGLVVLPRGLDESGLAYALWALLHGMAELQRAHLRLVRGQFETMQQAALENFLGPLAPEGEAKKTKANQQ
jgi:AcrR family transcriptional regulator